jgi:hypothetical protein
MSSQDEGRISVPRLLLCLVTAVIVAATAYLCAWFSFADYMYFRFESYRTRLTLDHLRTEIAQHQEKTGRLPAALADLGTVKEKRVQVDKEGRPVDSWGRPLHYEVQGDSYDLYSLGQDDLPGGVGWDADLHAGKVDRIAECLTLQQFTSLTETNGIKGTCILAGILAFPLCLLGAKREAAKRSSLTKVLVVHGVTAIFAILVAVVMSIVHLPSGH